MVATVRRSGWSSLTILPPHHGQNSPVPNLVQNGIGEEGAKALANGAHSIVDTGDPNLGTNQAWKMQSIHIDAFLCLIFLFCKF